MHGECSCTCSQRRQDAPEHLEDVANGVNRIGAFHLHHPVEGIHVHRSLPLQIVMCVWRHLVLVQQYAADEMYHLFGFLVNKSLALTIRSFLFL
jgi:hypothetical protein